MSSRVEATEALARDGADPQQRAAKVPFASWYALAVLTTISLFSYMDRTAISILLEPIKLDLDLSDTELGLLSGMAFAFLHAILGLPLARLADRSSRVNVLAACFAVWSAMTAVCGLTSNFVQLFLARMGVGVGEAGCLPPAHSIIGDLFPRERRALAIGILQSGAALGGSIGLYFIGAIGEHFGWRVALQAVGLAGFPVLLLVMLTLREPPRPMIRTVSAERFTDAMRAILTRPAFVYLVAGFSLCSLGTQGIAQWTPTFLVRTYGMSLSAIGGWYGLSSAIGGIFGLLIGGIAVNKLMRRDPRWELWTSAACHVVVIPLLAVMILSPNWWLSVGVHTLVNFFSAMAGGAGLSAVQSFAEPRRRATAVALLLLVTGLLGAGAGPYIVGLITDMLVPEFGRHALRYAMLIIGVMLVPGIVCFVLAGLRSSKDRAA
jgi:MFS family permease